MDDIEKFVNEKLWNVAFSEQGKAFNEWQALQESHAKEWQVERARLLTAAWATKAKFIYDTWINPQVKEMIPNGKQNEH